MHGAAHLVDAAFPIGLQLYAEIEIRNDVERGELVEQVTVVDRVHAAEDHVAACHGTNGVGMPTNPLMQRSHQAARPTGPVSAFPLHAKHPVRYNC